MDYDHLGGQGGGKAASSAAAGASLFNTSGKGEREWRSATDGSVITSSAKVGIAVAQQRAPPDNTPSYFSNHSQSSGAGGSSSMLGGSSSIAGAAAANSAAAAATLVAGQTALDLNSFQQLYSQAVAGLPLSVPAANLQPAIPFPVAYWPPMQIPTAAAAVQYQALGNILRSSSSAAALSGAAAAYPASLLQPTTLAALGAAAALPPASTSSNLEPLLAAAAANNSQIRSTDWNDNPLLVVSSGSLQSSDLSNLSSINTTTPSLLQQTINSVTGGSVVPELGKVYAYPRKQCDLSSAESPHSASGISASDLVTSVGGTSSFGKTIGFVRKPKPFADNASLFTNRESIKSDVPKINLPTRSLTIPTSSYHSRSNSPQSPLTPVHQQICHPHSNSQPTPTPPPVPVQSPPVHTIPTQLPSDAHLPPKMRGKAAQQQMTDNAHRGGLGKFDNTALHVTREREIASVSPPLVVERERHQPQPTQRHDTLKIVYEQHPKYEKYDAIQPTVRSIDLEQDRELTPQHLHHHHQQQRESPLLYSTNSKVIEQFEPPKPPLMRERQEDPIPTQSLRLQRVAFEENAAKHSGSPPAPMTTHRERTPKEISGGSMENYVKCMENVIIQYQKHSAEGRLAEFSELCKRASDQDYDPLSTNSPSAAGMGLGGYGSRGGSSSKMQQRHSQDMMTSSVSSPSPSTINPHQLQQQTGRSSLVRLQQQSNFVYDSLDFSPTSASSQHEQQPLLQARLSAQKTSTTPTIQDRDSVSASSFGSHHHSLLPYRPKEENHPTLISDDDDDDEDDDDESVSSDSTICPESPPLVISYTKETLNEFCTRQYQSLLDDVEQPLKQVLASEDEDTAAKRKLIVLEQRVKRKLKMKFAGFDSEAKRAKLEAAASAVAAGSSSFSSLSRMSELSALGSPDAAPTTTPSNSNATSAPTSGVNYDLPMSSFTTPHSHDTKPATLAGVSHNNTTTTPRTKPTVSRVLQRKNTPSPGSSAPPPSSSLRHSDIGDSGGMNNSNMYMHSHPSSHVHKSHHSTPTAKGGNAPNSSSPYTTGGSGAHHNVSSSGSMTSATDSLKICTTDSRRSVHLSTDDLVSGQRVLLRQSDGLYAPGKLIVMQPPEIYGILVDGARGSKPQMLAYEELVRKAVLEIVPRNKGAIPKGTKVCAYFNRSFTVLHPGTVSFSSTKTLPHAIKIEFDDGEDSIVNLSDVRILSSLFNPVDYNILTPVYSPDSSSSSSGTAGLRNRKVVSIWKWDQKCLKETPLSKNIRAFYSSIVKADGAVYKDDFVAFHNSAPNSALRRPYIGKVINFFETAAGENFVKVSWYYRTEETKQGINSALPKNALLRSNHTDELDIQTISHKVEVLDQSEYMKFNQNNYMAAQAKGTSPDHLFVCAGTYDYHKGVCNLTFKKCNSSSSPSNSSIASTSSTSDLSVHTADHSCSTASSKSQQQQLSLPPESTADSSSSSCSMTSRLHQRQHHSNMDMKDRTNSSRIKSGDL